MKTINSAIFAALILFPGSFAFAATQGDEGETSTGTSDITVTIPKLVKITGVADLNGGNYDGGAGGFDEQDSVCIYSNMDTGTAFYTVNISNGSNPVTTPTDGFYVGSAATQDEIEFSVAWNDEAGDTNESAVTEGADLTTQNGFSNEPDCGSVDNANFHVTMTQADMLAVLPGTYTSTLTILITPE